MADQDKLTVLNEVHQTLVSRLDADEHSSYVASLYSKGLDTICKKIAEEAAETIMAAKDGEPDKIIYEVADLWFHSMVLLAQQGLDTQQVVDELARRMGTSGLTEKLARDQ
ncbi:MAG: phosphoribosyl-ATP pyrophosphohydrolase [Arenicella sp.]|jgi:phosphoribosyl-ATP pyrophosphohydrolase